MKMFSHNLQTLHRLLPKIGPYLLLEIALPGGTLLALLLYLYRRGGAGVAPSP